MVPRVDHGKDGHAADTPADDVAAALGQVIEGYRSALAGDVSAIRELIRQRRIEEALQALERQRRSLEVAAACLDGVVADATGARDGAPGHGASGSRPPVRPPLGRAEGSTLGVLGFLR